MHKLINLTPHAINIRDKAERLIMVVPPSGTVARVQTTRREVESITLASGDVSVDIPLFRTIYGSITDLPSREYGTCLIVSLMVKQATQGQDWPERPDLVSPGELVRDTEGNPIGCIGLTY